jgi:hypothetical protein
MQNCKINLKPAKKPPDCFGGSRINDRRASACGARLFTVDIFHS